MQLALNRDTRFYEPSQQQSYQKYAHTVKPVNKSTEYSTKREPRKKIHTISLDNTEVKTEH